MSTLETVEIRFTTSAGQFFFPDWQTITLSPLLNDMGGVEFTCTSDAQNFALLYAELDDDRDVPFQVWIDGTRQAIYDFYVNEMSGDDIVEGSSWTFTGSTNEYRLLDAVVAPRQTQKSPSDPAPSDPDANVLTFSGKTAGDMMSFLMQEANGRGCFQDVTFTSFGATKDSNGVAWASTISIGVSPGTDYLTFAKALVSLQMADFQMVGKDLRLYNYGTLSQDQTVGNNPLIFRFGRDMVDSPRDLTVRDACTALIYAADNGYYASQSDDDARANRGRRIERYESFSGIKDAGTLLAVSQQKLGTLTPATLEKTNGLSFTPDSLVPIHDFDVGDWVYTDVGNGLERYRIQQWVVSVDQNGVVSGSVTLNDLIADRAQKLTDQIDGIVGGTTILGTSQAQSTDVKDTTVPSPPTGITIATATYQTPQGRTLDIVSVAWAAPTTNTDGSTCDDLDHYGVQWALSDSSGNATSAWSAVDQTPDTNTAFSGVAPNTKIVVRVRAADESGHLSDWVTATAMTISDQTKPHVPSKPVVDSYLGTVRAYWDGLDSAGANMPVSFDHIEVHWSTSASFTPSSSTLTDTLGASGYSFNTNGQYGTSYYCKFIAVDRLGNRSDPTANNVGVAPQKIVTVDVSNAAINTAQLVDDAITNAKIAAQAVGTTEIQSGSITNALIANAAISTANIQNAAIGTAQIADLAVQTGKIANAAINSAQIANLAVNDAQIGSVAAGKITAGTISSQVLVSGRIATATTGARCVFDANGIHVYDSNGNLVLDGNSNGSVTLTGAIQSGTAGTRVMIDANGGTYGGAISFWSSASPSTTYPAQIQGYAFSGARNSLYLKTTRGDGANVSTQVGTWVILLDGDSSSANRSSFQAGVGNGGEMKLSYNPSSSNSSSGFGGELGFQVYPPGEVAGAWGGFISSNASGGYYSPYMILTTSAGIGGMFDWYSQSSTHYMRVMYGDAYNDVAYEQIRASNVALSSARQTKTNIRTLDVDAVAIVNSTKTRRYRRKVRSSNPNPQEEIGLVWDETHELLRAEPGETEMDNAIDMYAMTTILWKAVQELSSEIAELKGAAA